MKNLGIYVHIPFCRKKCNYCDFFSLGNNEDLIDNYITQLINEINSTHINKLVDTIFFGGGTPSLLSSSQLEKILNAILKKFNISQDAEITLETNPCTNNNFYELSKIGFNRVSFGVQSANDNELKVLGRLHTFEEFLKDYEKAREYFGNINLDLMYSIPNQTLKSWEHTLLQTKKLLPQHISAYSLIIEPDTPFFNLPKLNLPNEDLELQMQNIIEELLPEYNKYEISNYSLPNFECKHNLKYWNMDEYLGFGAGAHSFFDGYRLENSKNLLNWTQTSKKLSRDDFLSEYIFLGLRQTKGIELTKEIIEKYGDIIKKHTQNGMLIQFENNLKFTSRGMEISNYILADFI